MTGRDPVLRVILRNSDSVTARVQHDVLDLNAADKNVRDADSAHLS